MLLDSWAGRVYLLLLLVFGVVCISSPITIVRIIMLWPKFIFPKLFREEDAPPRTREALHLIDEDPKEYAQRFKKPLGLIKVSGLITLFGVFVGLLITMMP